MFYFGIDIAKRNHEASVIDSEGKPLLDSITIAGLDVKVTQSGDFTETKQHISERGSPYLRRAIWLAADRTAFCDPILPEPKNSGKHHLTAVGAASRKMCSIIFAILKEGRPYEATPPNKIIERTELL